MYIDIYVLGLSNYYFFKIEINLWLPVVNHLQSCFDLHDLKFFPSFVHTDVKQFLPEFLNWEAIEGET